MHGSRLWLLQGRESLAPFCAHATQYPRKPEAAQSPEHPVERGAVGSSAHWLVLAGGPIDRAFPFHLTQRGGHAHSCAGGVPLKHGALGVPGGKITCHPSQNNDPWAIIDKTLGFVES